jgi:hypothetical protein
MRSRILIVAAALAVLAKPGLAQPGYNITNIGTPYSRPAITPYLGIVGGPATNYYFGTLREFDIRAQLIRPIVVVGPDALSGYDPARFGSQSVMGYQSAEDWVNQMIRERQLSPTGHPAGFLLAYPYYRIPNQRSFVPYYQYQGQGQGTPQQGMPPR